MTADQAEPIPAEVERVGRRVIGSSITVHRTLGPGYKESIYVEALCLELDSRGLKFEREKPISVLYKGKPIPGQRLDLIVEGCLVVECKAVEAIVPVHLRQVTSYLRTTGLRLGFIFNFNVSVLMPDGFARVAVAPLNFAAEVSCGQPSAVSCSAPKANVDSTRDVDDPRGFFVFLVFFVIFVPLPSARLGERRRAVTQ
jgi:GxxExxY protein